MGTRKFLLSLYALLCTAILQAGTGSYFTVDLPEDWVKVSKASLETYNKAESDLKKDPATPSYCAAYQRRALLDFEMPYVLVEKESHAPYSKAELRALAQSLPHTIRGAYLPLHRKGLYGEVNVMPAVYDEVRNMVLCYYEMVRAKPMTPIMAFVACYPSKAGLVKLHGFGKKADYERNMKEFEHIMTSLKFAEEYQYVPAEKKSNFSRYLSGFCLVALVALMGLRFYGRLQNGHRQPFSRKNN